MKIAFIVAAAFLASAATAADAPATGGGATPAAAPKEKKICHTYPPETGSNMSRRVCKTATQWAQEEQDEGMTLRKFHDATSQLSANPH
jgi:ABC-type sugar transport system substrate-binding protein